MTERSIIIGPQKGNPEHMQIIGPATQPEIIEKIFMEFRSAPPPKHEFVIMSNSGQPTLVDLAQLERDEKAYKKKKEEPEKQ